MQRSHLIWLAWFVPLLSHSADAHAWGLYTHIYFAQWLVWSMPLLDPRLRQAALHFPRLVMAGACLPDLALMSPKFRDSHLWDRSQELLRCARTDEERAIAVGYASHLFVDVIAHNHFVPAHEQMWLPDSLLTHIFGEWAMDAHLAPLADATPYDLLRENHAVLAPLVARAFDCDAGCAARALRRLAAADRLLRKVRLPQFLYHSLRLLDRRVFHHFVYYVSQTQAAIAQIDGLFAGKRPLWEAEPSISGKTLLQQLRNNCVAQLHARHHAPIAFFAPAYSVKEMLAIKAPIAAAASTSLG